MAELGIEFTSSIHAEIAQGNFTMLSNTSEILDPISLSYSLNGVLVYYKLSIAYSEGVSNIKLLNNGKNSRVSVADKGYFQVQLYIRDDQGLEATDLITIIVE